MNTRGAISPNQRAFSLVELLVVLAIIGVLASLLLPALARAKSRGTQAACFNNLRQLGLAWELYTVENDGVYPYNDVDFGGDFFNRPGSWVLGNAQRPAPGDLENGSLFEFVPSVRVYRCPADKSTYSSFRVEWPKQRTYSLSVAFNTFGAASVPAANPLFRSVTKSDDLPPPGPSAVFTFVDMHELAIDSGEFAFLWTATGWQARWEHKPTDRHRGGANIAFADGHAEYKQWRYDKRFTRYGDAPANEDDLQDLEWLRDRLPRK